MGGGGDVFNILCSMCVNIRTNIIPFANEVGKGDIKELLRYLLAVLAYTCRSLWIELLPLFLRY